MGNDAVDNAVVEQEEQQQPNQPDDAEDKGEEQEPISLSEVLGMEAQEEAGGDPEPEPEPAPTADEKDAKPKERTFTQADIDRIVGQRVGGERAKWEREHAADLGIAKQARALYQGKDAGGIAEALLDARAQEMAEKENVPIGIAKRLLRLEAGQKAAEPAPSNEVAPGEPAPGISALAEQVREIQSKEHVDMIGVLKDNPALRDKVAAGTIDMREAFNQWRTGQKPPAPRAVRGGAKDVRTDIRRMPKSEFDRISAALDRGEVVRID